MYKQELYNILEDYIKPSTLKKYNRHKSWKYGYDEQHDMVVISKDGTIGEIYEIQNLKIALPNLKMFISLKITNGKSLNIQKH